MRCTMFTRCCLVFVVTFLFARTAFSQAPPPVSFQPAVNYPVGTTPTSVAVGDFRGNGNLDLAVTNFNSDSVSVLLGNGDGTFQPAVSFPVSFNPSFVAADDFISGNRRTGLVVVGSNNSTLNIFLSNGDGTFQAGASYAVGSAPSEVPTKIAVGDFNGDGNLDLAVSGGCCPSYAAVLLGNGDGTFQAPVYYMLPTGAANSITVGDFNDDGKLDLAVGFGGAGGGGDVYVLLGNGDGTFQAPAAVSVPFSVQGIATGDFRNVGIFDLAVTDAASHVGVLLGNGDGTFQPAVSYTVPGAPNGIAVSDFNSDGNLDLVTSDETGNNVSVLLGNGDGTFQAPVTFPTGSNSIQLTVGNFNHAPDITVVDQAVNTVSILLNASVSTTKDQCKKGGWQYLFRADGTTFTNQGNCIQYVNTGK